MTSFRLLDRKEIWTRIGPPGRFKVVAINWVETFTASEIFVATVYNLFYWSTQFGTSPIQSLLPNLSSIATPLKDQTKTSPENIAGETETKRDRPEISDIIYWRHFASTHSSTPCNDQCKGNHKTRINLSSRRITIVRIAYTPANLIEA